MSSSAMMMLTLTARFLGRARIRLETPVGQTVSITHTSYLVLMIIIQRLTDLCPYRRPAECFREERTKACYSQTQTSQRLPSHEPGHGHDMVKAR